MERPFDFIADITDKKDMWKLAVRVKEKWTVVKDVKEHVEMIIVDAKGTDVQVLIPTDYKAAYDKILEVNATYSLSNFQVFPNNLLFKASEHKFLLKWIGGTTAVDVNVHPIPAAPTKFKSFAEIISGKWKPDILVNVIGVVQDMGYCQLNPGNGKKLQVNFTMKDLSDIVLNCTLWEDYAGKFIQYNSNRKEGGPVVVMMQYCKIKAEGCRRCALSVSNTYTYTRLFINDNITEINNFRGRYKLEMTVSYAEEKTTFVFWDREVTQLLGIAASQLRANMIQAGITNRLEYPLMMDGLSGKSIVAKVKWQPKWKTCSVVCFKDGSPSPFVDKVISKFPHYQLPAPQNVQDGQADDMVADQHVQENDVTLSNPQLSASSEYDPEISTQITPLSKLQNVDECKDLDSLSQLRTTDFQDVDETAPVHQVPTAVITEAESHAETNLAKQSSSKRVKLIKQEKK